jgi:hypothetical protein
MPVTPFLRLRYVGFRAVALALLCNGCSDRIVPLAPQDQEPPPDVARNQLGASAVAGTEYFWNPGDPPNNMGPTNVLGTDRVCFLTQVHGVFAGAGDEVRIYNRRNVWYLDGTSFTGNGGGHARCMLVASFGSEHLVTAPVSAGQQIVLSSPHACFLTGVGGELATGDYVYLARKPVGTNWELGAVEDGGASSWLIGRARCAQMISGNNDQIYEDYSWYGATRKLTKASNTVCVLSYVGGPLQVSGTYVAIDKRMYSDGQYWVINSSLLYPATSPEGGARCFM